MEEKKERDILPQTKDDEPVSPFVLMTDVIGKLRLLNYSAVFPNMQLTHFSFVTAPSKNKAESFRKFVTLATWLMKEHLNMDFEELDVYMEAPYSVARNIEAELKKREIPCEPASKLATGYGLPIITVLDNLLTQVLIHHEYTFGQPQFRKEDCFVEDDTQVHDSDSDNIIDDTIFIDESDDDVDYVNTEEYLTNQPQNEIIETNVDSTKWKMELEKVEPMLVLRLSADHKDWRTHVESMEKSKKSLEKIHEVTVSTLTKMSEDIAKVTSRIRKREQMLASDHSISLLLEQYRQQQEKLATVMETYKQSEENVSKLSADLVEINASLDAVKNEVDTLSKQMSDTTPLQEIKKAQARIKREISEMDLRTGVLQHTVLQARTKKKLTEDLKHLSHSNQI